MPPVPEHYDLEAPTIEMPCARLDPAVFYRPWGPSWLSFEASQFDVSQCVSVALRTMAYWSSALSSW